MITGLQLVRRYFPRATEADANFILWELTPYPCGNPRERLEELAAKIRPKKRGWMRRLGYEYEAQNALLEQLSKEWALPEVAVTGRKEIR